MINSDTKLIAIKCRAEALSDAALLAYWNPTDFHRTNFKQAKDDLVAALADFTTEVA